MPTVQGLPALDTRPKTCGSRAHQVWNSSTSCADILRRCGFTAKKIGGAADGGRDILIWNGSRKIVVECKHHAKTIGRPAVQKLHSATMTEGAVGGVLISTGGFSSEAAEHTNARSSPDALNAIRHMRLGDIVLVDLDGLRQLAKMANVMLRDGEDPATRDVPLEPLVGLFADLKSSPTPAKDLIRCEVLGHRVDTCWVADASIEQDFYNSAGRKVYRMTEKRAYACGSDGTILDGRLAKLVMSGGDAITKGGNRDVVRSSIVADMKKRYKKRVGYRGRNGVHYTMTCEPGERYMHISPKTVGVKRTAAAVKILRMRLQLEHTVVGRQAEVPHVRRVFKDTESPADLQRLRDDLPRKGLRRPVCRMQENDMRTMRGDAKEDDENQEAVLCVF